MLGEEFKKTLDAPFTRFSNEIADQPEFFDEDDREKVHNTVDNLERLKPFVPKEGTTSGEYYHAILDDNDEKFKWNGVEGDTQFTEPPDSNYGPAVDHRMDEERIWNFTQDIFARDQIYKNEWITNPFRALKKNWMPWWKDKLLAPDYKTLDKIDMFNFQWNIKREFEQLKNKQAWLWRQGQRDVHTQEKFTQ